MKFKLLITVKNQIILQNNLIIKKKYIKGQSNILEIFQDSKAKIYKYSFPN